MRVRHLEDAEKRRLGASSSLLSFRLGSRLRSLLALLVLAQHGSLLGSLCITSLGAFSAGSSLCHLLYAQHLDFFLFFFALGEIVKKNAHLNHTTRIYQKKWAIFCFR